MLAFVERPIFLQRCCEDFGTAIAAFQVLRLLKTQPSTQRNVTKTLLLRVRCDRLGLNVHLLLCGRKLDNLDRNVHRPLRTVAIQTGNQVDAIWKSLPVPRHDRSSRSVTDNTAVTLLAKLDSSRRKKRTSRFVTTNLDSSDKRG